MPFSVAGLTQPAEGDGLYFRGLEGRTPSHPAFGEREPITCPGGVSPVP